MKKIFSFSFILAVSIVTYAQNIVLSTDFQSGIPSNFTLLTFDGNSPDPEVSEFIQAWIGYEEPDNETNKVAASTSYFATADTADRWMITPEIQMGTVGNYLTWKAKSQDPSFPDDYYVLISTAGIGIENFVDTVGYVEEENAEWTTRTVNLSEKGYDNQLIRIAFINRTFDGFKLYIDDLEVRTEDHTVVNDLNLFSIQPFPNPFNDVLNLKNADDNTTWNVYNFDGKIIESGNGKTVNTSTFSRGSYFICVQHQGTTNTFKIIK